MTATAAFISAAIFVRADDARANDTPLRSYSGVSISPDGQFIADVESIEPPDETREPVQHLIVRGYSGDGVREIATPCADVAGCTISSPAWSSDSREIVFVVHAPKAKERQLFVATIAQPQITNRRILAFEGTLISPKFAPDGTSIAALAIPNARKEVGATQAGAAIVGEIGMHADEQRIVIVPLDGSAFRYASPPDLFVYEYDWMPDGSGFAGTAAHGDGDNNWWVSRLYRFDATSANALELYHPASAQMQIASPRVSPDGSHVAFIGGIMSDFGSTGGDLYTLALAHANAMPVDLTPNAPSSVTSVMWLGRSNELLVTRLRADQTEITRIGGGAKPTTLSSQAVSYSAAGASISASSVLPLQIAVTPQSHAALSVRLAAVVQSFERAPEIATSSFAYDGTATPWTSLTSANANVPNEGHAQSVRWHSDSFDAQGWLLTPVSAPSGKRPLITIVHGGPAAANVPRFVTRGAVRDFLRHGYDVFLPNPRGSFGEGEAFTLGNVKDFGYGDLRDILSGIDAAEKIEPIDEARLGITGGSYGGFMTMWAVTQTHRFKAAVAGAGIANWISYYGENGIDEWMIPYFGASAYEDPEVYRKSSPIDFIKNVTTPTFEYVGERDVECPAPQSQEFWHALDSLGVPTSLVIYEGEDHRIASPAHTADVTARTLAWFDKYLK